MASTTVDNQGLLVVHHPRMIDLPPDPPITLHFEREHCRLTAQGHRTDDNTPCTLVVIHEASGWWAIHGLGAPGVRLGPEATMDLAQRILRDTPR